MHTHTHPCDVTRSAQGAVNCGGKASAGDSNHDRRGVQKGVFEFSCWIEGLGFGFRQKA